MTIEQALHLALQHHQSGRLAEAEAIYRQVLAVDPRHAGALHLLGCIARRTGRSDLAVELIGKAIALAPNFPEAQNNLGDALQAGGQLDPAMAAYRQAIALRPNFAEAHYNLGVALLEAGRPDDAIASYRRAVALRPGYWEALTNLGSALTEQGRLDEAVTAHREAVALRPDFAEGHANLGNALQFMGRLDDAIAAFRQALALKPDFPEAHANLIYNLHCHAGANARSIAEEQRNWNRQYAAPSKVVIKPHANDPNPARRLRIGYVSPNFRDHVLGRNVMPLFQRHDLTQFEVFCYSGVRRPDDMTGRFHRLAGHWRETRGMTDGQLADQIRTDGVDILVDLSLHTADNRLPVFAHKPAPVQASFAAYPGSTGLDAIGYRISDRHLECGPVTEAYGDREQVCLLESFWCYDPLGPDVPVNALPAAAGGAVTFGCLGNFFKINERVLALWARVLGLVEGSRLIILSDAGSHRERTLATLHQFGVGGARVEFAGRRTRREYLELYHRVDIGLDTFPYNGHTTSLDAFWMGVPVIGLAGDLPVSRAGLSNLMNLGLPELVAHSEDEYVSIAAALAGDLPRLASLRATLRERMERSVLMDAPRFARQIEAAYRTMWQAWCATKKPPLH